MKTIYLLRHAKSSWNDANLPDFDRPLNARGRLAAPLMGAKILRERFSIDLIISSPATRASQTAIFVKDAARIESEIEFDRRIYQASPQHLLKVASEISDAVNSAMLVGHNPGLEDFIKLLTGQIEAMPTAALAVIDLKIGSWNEIDADCGSLRELFRPKSLEQF